MKELLQNYQAAGALLDAQRKAFESGDEACLGALLEDLKKQSRLLENQTSLLGSIDGESKEQVRSAIEDLFRKIEVVQSCWIKRRQELERLQSQLRSGRRLSKGLQAGEAPVAQLLDLAG
jgi:hypothetical protein